MKPTTLFLSILGAISTASISVLPSFAQTTPVPITGGNLSASANLTGILSINSASLLTSFGTITLTDGSGALTIPAINYNSSTPFNPPTSPTRLPAAGDVVNYSGLTSGIISGQSFTSATTNATGTVTSFSLSLATGTATGTAIVTSGTIALPSSLVSSLSGTTGGTNNSPISSIIPLNDVDASNLFNSQPVLESGNNFLPPSSLAGSRIHPDLSSR